MDREHAGEPGLCLVRPRHRAHPGGDKQPVEPDLLTVGQEHLVAAHVKPGGRDPEPPVRVDLVATGQYRFPRRSLADEDLLGQWRPVVRGYGSSPIMVSEPVKPSRRSTEPARRPARDAPTMTMRPVRLSASWKLPAASCTMAAGGCRTSSRPGRPDGSRAMAWTGHAAAARTERRPPDRALQVDVQMRLGQQRQVTHRPQHSRHGAPGTIRRKMPLPHSGSARTIISEGERNPE